MRVCLVSYEFPPSGGGEGVYTYNLARGLSDLGHQVSLVLPRIEEKRVPALPSSTKLTLIASNPFPFLKVAGFLLNVKRALPKLVRDEDLEVVHFTFDYPSLPLAVGAQGGPVLATIHHLHKSEALSVARYRRRVLMMPYFTRQVFLTRIEQVFVRRMSALIAVSNFTRRELVRSGIPSSLIHVVHNGIDVRSADGSDEGIFRRRFNLKNRPFILYVGRLEVSKGVEYLLAAYGKVKRQFPNLLLAIVGGGPVTFVHKLRSISAQTEGVIFTGRVSPDLLRSAYAGSSLVVLPSLMEGLGITVLEAMAASRACVATRVGGIPEVIRDGETGVLVEPGSVASLANGIARTLADPALAGSVGREARRVVQNRFSREIMSEATESVYKKAVESTKAPNG